jgi:uncharacterized delta-60 repeat protein
MKNLLIISLLCCSVKVFTQYGVPDPNFDGDGILTFNINDSSSAAFAVKAMYNNKILVAGFAYNGHDMDFALARIHPDGSPDNTFGTDGLVLTDFSTHDDRATSMKIQEDGKIILGGLANNGGSFAIARYNADGSPDNSFSSDGKVTPAEGIGVDFGPSLLLQEDGKIIIAGSDYHNSDYYFSMVRYTSSGTIDNTFSPDINALPALINCATLQPDGKILAGGQVAAASGVDQIIARFNSDGSVDNTFSYDGMVTFNKWPFDVGNALIIQNDQKILAAGYYYGAIFGLELLRYDTDGLIDASFADNGYYTYTDTAYNSHEGFGLYIQPDEKILLGGTGYNGYSWGPELFRLNSDGSMDPTFGDEGIVHIYSNQYASANSIDLQPDGKIVACGTSSLGPRTVMSVFRLTSGLPPLSVEGEENSDAIGVQPNPFTAGFRLSYPNLEKNTRLDLIASDGRIVFSSSLVQPDQEVNPGNISPGAYIMRMVSDDKIISRLIIKE